MIYSTRVCVLTEFIFTIFNVAACRIHQITIIRRNVCDIHIVIPIYPYSLLVASYGIE